MTASKATGAAERSDLVQFIDAASKPLRAAGRMVEEGADSVLLSMTPKALASGRRTTQKAIEKRCFYGCQALRMARRLPFKQSPRNDERSRANLSRLADGHFIAKNPLGNDKLSQLL